jgi:hypothetical protein
MSTQLKINHTIPLSAQSTEIWCDGIFKDHNKKKLQKNL